MIISNTRKNLCNHSAMLSNPAQKAISQLMLCAIKDDIER